MDESVALLTVTVVVPLIPEAVAVMVTLPSFLPLTTPVERMEAICGLDDFHVKPLRLLVVLPSLKVPMAVNLSNVCCCILGLAGLMAMLTRSTAATVRPVEPLMEPEVAVMVTLPAATLETSPWLLMVARVGSEELHSTETVMSWVLLSLNVPVAVNCFVVPMAMLELLGVTAIETRVAAVTVSEAVPLTDPEVAVMVTEPMPVLVARPDALTDATLAFDDDHVTDVSCCVLPSLKKPVAMNCWSVPMAIDGVAGVTEIETRLAGTTVRVAVSLNDPTVAVMVAVPCPAVVARPLLSMLATLLSEELQVTPLARSCDEPSL